MQLKYWLLRTTSYCVTVKRALKKPLVKNSPDDFNFESDYYMRVAKNIMTPCYKSGRMANNWYIKDFLIHDDLR